jgi:hypothetical protein
MGVKKMKKRRFDFQIFAEDAASDPATVPAGSNDDKAATAQPKDEKPGKSEKDEKKYSDADLDEIIGKKFAKWQKDQEKKVDEAKKLAAMNEQQKAEYERDQLQKQLDEYKRKDTLSEMTKTARKMLTDAGIPASDEVLSILVTTDAEKTKNAVDSYSKAFKAAVEDAVKERLKGNPPTKGTGGGVGTMTKAEILAIKDPELRQKKMLENKHLFNF